MIRRSRISVRPNVKPTGRPAATSRETPQGNESPAEVSNDSGVKVKGQGVNSEVGCNVPAAEANDKTGSQIGDVSSQSCLGVTAGDVSDQSASTSSLSTRRKRFSALPNLSKPRNTPSFSTTSTKHSKSPVRPESTPEIPSASTHTSSDVSGSPDNQESAQEPAPKLLPFSTKSLRSPAPRLPSSSAHNTSRALKFLNKAVISPEPAPDKTLPAPECTLEPPPGSIAPSKRKKPKPITQTQNSVETSSSRPDEVDPQSANQDPGESSQSDPEPVTKSQNGPVVQDGSDLKPVKPEQHVPLALRTLNDPADRLRLARAKKLRELLKKEMNKEKQKEKHQRPQTGASEVKKSTKDHTKMTMRELIYYLPSTNPMKSSVEDEQRVEMDFPSSPKAVPALQSVTEQNAEEQEKDEEQGGEGEEPMLAPRVKVAEDGSLIIDEESLTVRVQRMKGPNPAEDRDPIFERGSTTTYSSFRKGTYTKPWSNRETDMFFLAISMVGTDFSMIGQLFPHRARIEIKNKFKKEERANSWRIDKAFKEKQRLDLDFFNKLLAQILKDEEERRKKKKRTSQMDKIPRRRPGERKRKIYSSDSEEDESSGSDTREGEKEKENVCDDGGSSATSKRKRGGASPRRSKHTNQSVEEEGDEETERSVNEKASPVIELDSAEEDTESFGVKPVRRLRNRAHVFERESEETHTSVREKNTKESDSDTRSALVQEKKRHTATDVLLGDLPDSEDEDEPDLTAIQEHILNKPTRSGRIPKLSQHMIRAAADEEDDEEEEQPRPPHRPPEVWRRGCRGKRGRSGHVPRTGKSTLVTLRASPTEDVEEEYQDEENDFNNAEEENQAFIPRGLRSITAVQAEVEETMEELDISVNVPDILGISQNAACPESSCERALSPTGSVPCEHQLNLLVDVIEFLTPEHMEVSEEAARTLLTIGHSAHVNQSGETSSTGDIIIIEDSSSQVHEEVLVETMDESQTEFETCIVVPSDPTSETEPVTTVITGDKTTTPPCDSASTAEPISSQESTDHSNELQTETLSISTPETTSSKTRRNRLPKPNVSKTSRVTQKEPVEEPSSSAETLSAPKKGDEQAVESQLSTPKAPSQTEPEEHISEICEEKENDRREDCSSGVSLEKMVEETQQTQSKSIPRSSDCESSVKPSQPVRRCRGPKPKPNLVRSVRTTHTFTHTSQKLPAVPDEKPAPVNTCTDTRQPDEDAQVLSEPGRENHNDPETVIPDADPEELPTSACEPVFILSLTEVLPTLTEGAGLVADPLPLPAASGLQEPISPIESPSADAGGTGPAGDQVFSQLLTDALIPVSEERENRGKQEESSILTRRREHSPLIHNSSTPEEPAEPPVEPSSSSHKTEESIEETELSAKRRKHAPSSRRAEIQIKPNPIPRKTFRELPSPDETASGPGSSHEMMLEETESKHVSTGASKSDKSDETSTDSTSSRPHVRTETPPPQSPPSSSSQRNVENPHTDPAERSVVQQNTPPAPLTRPGRRPKGFLSFMSSTNVQRPSESSRVPQRPAVVTPRAGRRRPATSTTAPPTAPPPPSSPNVSSEPHAETSSAAGENQEPTSVSAFFFNDIFTVVDEQVED